MVAESDREPQGASAREWLYRPHSTGKPADGAELCPRSFRERLVAKSTEPATGIHGKGRLERVCSSRLTRFVRYSPLSRWLPQTAGHRRDVFLKTPVLIRIAS